MLRKEHAKVGDGGVHGREWAQGKWSSQLHHLLGGTKEHETEGLIFMSCHQAQFPM